MRRIRHGFYSNIGVKGEEVVDRFTLTALDLTTLHTLPVSLVAAPGANKALIVRAMVFQFKWGTVAFTAATGGAVNPVYHGATVNLLTGSVAAATILGTANAIVSPGAPAAAIAVALNTGVDLYAATADFAGAADSTADVTLYYTVYET